MSSPASLVDYLKDPDKKPEKEMNRGRIKVILDGPLHTSIERTQFDEISEPIDGSRTINRNQIDSERLNCIPKERNSKGTLEK